MIELAKLTRQDLNRIAPLIRNLEAWDAFLYLLKHEEAKVLLGLLTAKRYPNAVEEMHRLSGKIELIQDLKQAKDRLTALEKDLK